MLHKNFVMNKEIKDHNGSTVKILNNDGKYKYFALVVQGGHVGNGYYMPICFAITAQDMQTAIDIARNSPRVKRSSKYAILSVCEISLPEYKLILYNNEHDPYLCSNTIDQDSYEAVSRRVVSQQVVEDYYYAKGLPDNDWYGIEKVPHGFYIKTADEYQEYQVLQRAFAPLKYGEKYVFPKNVKLQDILPEYYYQLAVINGIHKNEPLPLIYYYEIFGNNNPMGLVFEDGCLKYTSKNNKDVYVPLFDNSRLRIETRIRDNNFELGNFYRSEVNDFEVSPNIKLTSAKDKFNQRLAKHEAMKNQQLQRGE